MIVRFMLKDIPMDAGMQERMEKKLHKRLDSYYKNEPEDRTTVSVKITEKRSIYKVEINMPYAGHQLRTENEERETPVPALDKGIDLLERQIRKHKTRMNRSLRDTPTPMESVTIADITEGDEGEVTEFNVVKVKQYAAKPMTVQDAIFQMDLLGHTFFTFHNAETSTVSTVYRRNDGDYGLIELTTL